MGLQGVQASLQQWLMNNPHANMFIGGNTFERWVVEQLLIYVNAILQHGSWVAAGLPAPKPAVVVLAGHYGISVA